ncbi:sensory transduction histidine kinase, putative [Aspergillus oryzae 100-8]|uniref:histidine kinase n=1 Tax=Aspergillus oryzae (strain 3.042) TaxID=1160506 RepID=I8TLQ0_ASPO3|nr:sensory transduction histidine kinase, putative [Aspergillus oryzae 3.042]KDE85948.1 sensory transduction histidine kinase, putative [Aspergillus oryzae 100-8]|eukprot:EIT74818.1 sensory transduction histidine kinase, putative [Aspergillus oryzae 3.042]
MAAPSPRNLSAQQLADISPIGTAVLNSRDEILFLNRRFRELMTCQSRRAFDGWSQSIARGDYDRVAAVYDNALKANKALRIEYRTCDEPCQWRLLMLTPFGEEELRGLPLGPGGGSYCTITDITEEKRAEISQKKIAEEAQRRKEQQERFIDMISHEVRNPLSAILHCTEDILEAVQQKDRRNIRVEDIAQAAETISLCVAHQKKIVDDVLTFSKLDAEMFTLLPQRVQPRQHLAMSLMMFRPELRKHNIDFEYKLDHSYADCGVDWVVADLDRMSQVLVNLVCNAIKFTAKAGDEKKISVFMGASKVRPTSYPPNVVFFSSDESALRLNATNRPEWGEGGVAYLMVAVKDTGIGISEEAQKRLFERFNQATPRTETIYGGSGLGLNVSRRLCHLHGGEIGVSSKEGHGSTFGFFFTIRRSVESSTTKPPRQEQGAIAELCREVQALSSKVTEGTTEIANPTIRTSPEMTHVKEVSPGASKDGTWEHTARIAYDAGNTEVMRHSPNIAQSADQPQYREKQPSQSSRSQPDASKERRVLVVEDNVINQRIVARKLESLGFQVTAVSNGREALDMVQQSTFDCILMDQAMPVMDGNSATRAVRDLEKHGMAHIPVLGVTANVRAEQQAEMKAAGMDDVIHKPYKMRDLCDRIQQLMG